MFVRNNGFELGGEELTTTFAELGEALEDERMLGRDYPPWSEWRRRA